MSRRPRVVVLAPLPPPVTGQSLVTEAAVDALREVADVSVVDASGGAPAWNASRRDRLAAWRRSLRSFREAIETAPDVVYLTPAGSRLGLARDLASLALIPASVPLVSHIHVGDYGSLLRSPALGPLTRRVLQRSRRVIVPSHHAARSITDAARAPVCVVPNAVPRGLARSDGDLDDAWRQRRVDDGGGPVVAFLANMIPSKGADVLIEAAARLDRQMRLRIGGPWPSPHARQAFERRLAALGVEAEVVGPVARADVGAFLARASVFAFPSRYPHESFGLAALEAMASGCAVAAIDWAAIGEVVRDGTDGRLAPYFADDDRQSDAFASALADALDHAEAYGRAGAARARDSFSASAFSAALRHAVLSPDSP